MNDRKFELHNGMKGSALAIRVTPRASQNEITEVLTDGTIKIRLTAPPVEAQTNAALIKFLSEVLAVAPSKIDIVAGTSGRDKLVSILDLDSDTVHRRILKNLA